MKQRNPGRTLAELTLFIAAVSFVILVLFGCGKSGVTQEHIKNANSICLENQGVHVINYAEYHIVLEQCGPRCFRESGNSHFSMTVKCTDGTVVKKTWIKENIYK